LFLLLLLSFRPVLVASSTRSALLQVPCPVVLFASVAHVDPYALAIRLGAHAATAESLPAGLGAFDALLLGLTECLGKCLLCRRHVIKCPGRPRDLRS